MSAKLVLDFLTALEARDLDTVKGMLGPGFTMTFPGGKTMTDFEELVAWSKNRYRSIGKAEHQFDECAQGEDAVVYCRGVLHGEGLDGQPIQGVRFIDRFVFRDGKIVDQQVWNDLAEFLSKP